MNKRETYALMILLMVLSLILNRPARVRTIVVEKPTPSRLSDVLVSTNKQVAAYDLGMALSGGGVKALCHAGVLKAFDEQGLQPDILAGVSAGAVVAALYADGYSPDSIAGLFAHYGLLDVLSLDWPSGGLFSMNGFKNLLDTLLTAERFEDLALPVRVVATDLDRGQSVVFDQGPLVDALVASCSVPILFSPYVIDGVNYVDGGLLQNLPAFALRDDCKTLIGVSTGPMKNGPYDVNIPTIALRSYSFIFRHNATYAKAQCDVVIEPAGISHYSGSDIHAYRALFELGYAEGRSVLSDVKKQ
jgi:NTE family protein